jgi:YesN/AraC family two-component response regulator
MDQKTEEISIQPKGRVFLVEDEKLVIEDIRERLIKHGYTVIGTASSGREAIDAIKEVSPDVIVMDVRISGELNGIEVAIILQSYFEYPLAFVFLTGFSEDAFGYLKVLPEYIYLNKPFQEALLLDAIQRALRRRNANLRFSS